MEKNKIKIMFCISNRIVNVIGNCFTLVSLKSATQSIKGTFHRSAVGRDFYCREKQRGEIGIGNADWLRRDNGTEPLIR